MFYGNYLLTDAAHRASRNDDPAIAAYCEEMDYWEMDAADFYQPANITKLPFRLESGPETLQHIIAYIPGHNWIRLYFQPDAGNLFSITGAFTIDGHTLLFQPMSDYEYDRETRTARYALSEQVIAYEFAFRGPYLTLSLDGKSVELYANDFHDEGQIYTDNLLSADSAPLGDIAQINMLNDGSGESYCNFYPIMADGTIQRSAAGRLGDDGIFTFGWTQEDGTRQDYQLLYFYGGRDGIILCDGETVYRYNDQWYTRDRDTLSGSLAVEDLSKLDGMSESTVEAIVQTRSELLAELTDVFQSAGLNVQVDADSGEVALDAGILFAVDDATLSDEGKAFLQKFLQLYSSVVFSDAYLDFISGVLVEGHTDTQGNYDYNLALSQARADTVLAYCLSAENGLDAGQTAQFADILTAVGRAYDAPVYGEDGKVDMAASRRVAFRFLIALG